MIKSRITAVILFFVFVCIIPAPTYSQTGPNEEFEPYKPEEFPQWLRDLRRGEVIFIGSFPITLLVTTLVYDGLRAISNIIGQTPLSERSEFGSFTDDERPWIIVSGLSLSGIITIADAIIEARNRRRASSSSE